MRPLDNISVLDLSTTQAGRFCARILRLFGATVARPPGLSPALPELTGEFAFAASTMSLADDIYLDDGKHPVSFEPRGEALRQACLAADVIVETWRPGEIAQLGSDPLELAKSGKILLSITPFGQDGPRASWQASELTLQAYSGFLFLSGHPDREPVQAALEQMHLAAGRVGAFAACMALYTRSQSGSGKHLDVSIVEVAASLPPFHLQQYSHTGAIAGRGPAAEPVLDGRHLHTADGHICFATGGAAPFEVFSVILEDETLLDERFKSARGRLAHAKDLDEIVERCARKLPKHELFKRARELRVVAGVIQTVDDLLDCPHLDDRCHLSAVETPHGEFRLPKLGISAPVLDAPVSGPAATQRPATKALEQGVALGSIPNASSGAPLAGIRIVSVEDYLVLPWATVHLANLGAEVIHVEPCTGGRVRFMGVYPHNQPGEEFWNENSSYTSFERGKACLTIDLGQVAGKQVFRRLAATADIVMENNRAGVMERLGLGYDALAADNPDLILVRSSGYGQSGPFCTAGAFARTIDAMSGLTALTGYRQGEPLRANPSFMDMMGSWNNASAAILGLLYRQQTGLGMTFDVSMYEAGVSTIGSALVARQLGYKLERQGNWHWSRAPQGVYPFAGHDRWIAITISDDAEWQRLAQEIGEPWALDSSLAKVAKRLAVREELDGRIAGWTKGQDPFALEQRLQAVAIPAAVVRNSRDLILDEHLRARRFFQQVTGTHQRQDFTTPHPGTPIHEAGLEAYRARDVVTVTMGTDNNRLLRELGFSDDEIDSLRASGVINEKLEEGVVERPLPANLDRAIGAGSVNAVDPEYKAVLASLRSDEKL